MSFVARVFVMVNNQPMPTEPTVPVDRLPLYALFALVVQHQSFSEAARLTGLARSAVSQRIQRLEALVGTPLLRRTTRRVTPTEAGLTLFADAARLLEQADALAHTFDAELLGGRLRVNAALNVVTACLGEVLARFSARNPEVAVDLRVENRAVDLLETRDDVVVRVGRAVPPDAVARPLFDDELVVVGSPGYLAQRGTPSEPHELAHHRCLGYANMRPEEEWRFEVRRRAYSAPVRPSFTADDGGVLKQMAMAGQGLSSLPGFMVADDVRAGRLVQVLAHHARPRLRCWAILPAGRKATRRARLLVDFLAKELPPAVPVLP